jgi:D-threo-aldose 1-dehydrogenase
MDTREIASTGLRVTRLGMGCATLGDLWNVISDSQAFATIDACYDEGIRFFDTAPWYGMGKSELRLGFGIRDKQDAIVATKVGRVLHRGGNLDWASRWKGGLPFDLRFDYTYSGVIRSFEDSVQRLGIPTIHALAIHDLDLLYHGTPEAVSARFDELDGGGGHKALQELKSTAGVAAIGAGINRTGLIPRFLERFALDYFLVAMPYTLLSQEGLDELNLCHSRGVSVIIGAPYASGLLASGSKRPASYDYAASPAEMVQKTKLLEDACEKYDVPLAAAALQFVLTHPAVVSVIPGPNSVEQARQNATYLKHPIPAELWSDLRAQGLVHDKAPVHV